MCQFVGLCVLAVVMANVNSHPVKNVFASVDISHESGPEPSPGIGNFVQASLLALPEIPGFYVSSTTSATFQLAAREVEQPLSQIISVYDHSQNKANGFLNAEPIVDNIKEEDKYGNSGDKFAGVGRFIVNGAEGISNFVNKLFEAPRNGKRLVGKSVTEKLNQIGAQLVGL